MTKIKQICKLGYLAECPPPRILAAQALNPKTGTQANCLIKTKLFAYTPVIVDLPISLQAQLMVSFLHILHTFNILIYV